MGIKIKHWITSLLSLPCMNLLVLEIWESVYLRFRLQARQIWLFCALWDKEQRFCTVVSVFFVGWFVRAALGRPKDHDFPRLIITHTYLELAREKPETRRDLLSASSLLSFVAKCSQGGWRQKHRRLESDGFQVRVLWRVKRDSSTLNDSRCCHLSVKLRKQWHTNNCCPRLGMSICL